MQETKLKNPSLAKSSKRKQAELSLPAIPDKRYFTIGEVGVLCGVKPHVLRYWEQEFGQLKPVKRRGNRRYYQQQDVLIARQIRTLLYENGFTIEGARAKLTGLQITEDKQEEKENVVKIIIADLEGILQNLKATELS